MEATTVNLSSHSDERNTTCRLHFCSCKDFFSTVFILFYWFIGLSTVKTEIHKNYDKAVSDRRMLR